MPEAGCKRSLGAIRVHEPPDRAPAGEIGRGSGHGQAAHTRQRPDGFLAGRIDVKHADFVGGGEGSAEAGRKGLGPRVEVGLEDRDQPPRPELP